MTIAAIFPNRLSLILVLLPLIFTTIFRSANATCQLSFEQNNKLYNYSLTAPIRNFPHGILSEDGFYKVAANGTVLWFQLCDAMIFNHDPPTCIDCKDCGGNSRCGMGCSALVANIIGVQVIPCALLLDIHQARSLNSLIKRIHSKASQLKCLTEGRSSTVHLLCQ